VVILEGIPANVQISFNDIASELKRRRMGYGRGARMKVEKDDLRIIAGVRHGRTTGSPLSMIIYNSEWKKWEDVMSAYPDDKSLSEPILYPRPGHADLAGALKYRQDDIRNISERASARETAARVAAGSICKQFLHHFRIEIASHILSIGSISISKKMVSFEAAQCIEPFSPLRVIDTKARARMEKLIDAAGARGNTLGGVVEVIIKNVPAGLGSYIQWDTRLDASLAQAIMSIPSIKGVELGMGFDAARLSGSAVHDAISYDAKRGFYRKSNNAGGIEGGVSNGEEIRVKAAIKPVPTLKKPLDSVNIVTKQKGKASFQRSDVCAVNPVAVIAENVSAFVIAKYFLEKFGGDYLEETYQNYQGYIGSLR
jgi:chorismate synthase